MSTTVSFPGLGISLELNRVAFSVFGVDIYWYGVIICAGMVLALIFAMRMCKTFGIDQDKLVDIFLVGALVSVVCARAYYVVFRLDEFNGFFDMINIRDGGLAIYGAVIGAFATILLYGRKKKIRVFALLDMCSVGFLIGQSIGRWANFVNQEAFGTNTEMPWGMISGRTTNYLINKAEWLASQGVAVDPYMPVHPTFLYESLWCALGFVLLFLFIRHRRYDGQIAIMYIGWYGIGRAFIEGLRTDSLLIGGVIRVSQIVGIVCFAAAIALLAVIAKKRKKSEAPSIPYGNTEEWAAEYDAILAREAKKKQKKSEAAEPEAEEDAVHDEDGKTN